MKKNIFTILTLVIFILPISVRAQFFSVATGGQLSVKANSQLSAERVEISPSSNYLFNDNTGLASINSFTNFTSLPHTTNMYAFNSSISNYSGKLKVYYTDSELNSLAEGNLLLYYFNGSTWQLDRNSINDSTQNFVESSMLDNTTITEFALANCIYNTVDTAITVWGSFTWNNNTYTTTPVLPLTATFLNQYGCDSVVTINLTVNKFSSTFINSIFPNPCSNAVNVEVISTTPQMAKLSIMDALGNILSSKRIVLLMGKNQLPINMTTYSTGVYFIKLICESEDSSGTFIRRIIKQ